MIGNEMNGKPEIIETDQDIGSGVSFVKEAYLYIINPVSRNQHINQVNKHQGFV
ncbi:MAG: hypothetical protein IPG95_05425 [Saprospiraceae bacterium]|nr:hypothetical protein [Saprospiraceae bacterium]